MRVLIFCLMFTYCRSLDLKILLAFHINNMIPAERNINHLVEISPPSVGLNMYTKANPPADFYKAQEPKGFAPNTFWQPYLPFEVLQFGSPFRSLEISKRRHSIYSLTTTSCTTAYFGNQTLSMVEVLTVYSCVTYTPIRFTIEKRFMSGNRVCPPSERGCRFREFKIPVGMTPDELAMVAEQTERRASLAMKARLGLKAELASAAQLAQSSKFLDTLSRLRALLPKSEYFFNNLQGIQIAKANAALNSALEGRADQGIRDRIIQILATASHSNFLIAPTDSHLYFLIAHKTSSSAFDLHVRLFVAEEGKKLPTGAFAISLGAWRLERGGAGAVPSMQQIMAAFPYE